MSSVEDEDVTKQTLLEWATTNRLGDAVLSDDGAALSLSGSTTLSGTALITVEFNEKSCTYSVASVFLQIVDPNQGLIAYRNACKKFGCDPVKALDKPTIVGFFLGAATEGPPPAPSTAAAATSAPSTTVPDAAVTAQAEESGADAALKAAIDQGEAAAASAAPADAETTHEGDEAPEEKEGDRRHREKSKHREDRKHKDKHHRSSSRKDNKERSGSDRKHKSSSREASSSSAAQSPQRKKKKAKIVTNEQLFSNLSMVVDKRQLERKAQEEITLALSAEGFQVTPEMLEEHRETTQMILANEIPVGNSASILRATNPKKNLSRVLELYLETINPGKGSKGKPGHRSSSSGGPTSAPTKAIRTHLIGKKPVIIVPKGMTSPITLLNAHEFLCNGKFVPRDVMLKQVGGQRGAMSSTTFTRKVRSASGNHSGLLEFEIMDNPRKLGSNPKEWERIVAVIVLGQSWQFKDWPPPYNNPVQLFSQTLGFFISMEGDKIPAEISGWAVKQAKLNRDKRGLDSVTYAGFWNALEEFMAVHRAELLPQQEV